jgi:hypothetical protein
VTRVPTDRHETARHADTPSGNELAVLSSTACPFSELGDDLLQGLSAAMRPREFLAGEHLIRQGDPGDHLLVIVSGTAQAFISRPSRDPTPIGDFRPGDVVGEIGVLTGEARTADVICRTPVRALVLSVADFHTIANAHPEVRILLTNVIADRLGKAAYDGLGGKDIHGYRIDRCVGRGGMGVVYQATRLTTGQTVALKMLNHRVLHHPGGIQRFRREADALALLRHESIASLYDSFSAYGTQFLVMEFCEGANVKDLIAAGHGLGEPVVKKIVGQLAVALRYVHGRGLIHRDLKPSNIIVGPSGIVKLLDFGLVRPDPTRPGGSDTPTRTMSDSGAIQGTLRYMAPEQFGRDVVDYRVDFYGLACVAFEALSGRPVIEASDLLGVIQEKLQFELPPPEAIGPGVTREMHEVLARGLDPRPEKRAIDLDRLAAWAAPVAFDDVAASAMTTARNHPIQNGHGNSPTL